MDTRLDTQSSHAFEVGLLFCARIFCRSYDESEDPLTQVTERLAIQSSILIPSSSSSHSFLFPPFPPPLFPHRLTFKLAIM